MNIYTTKCPYCGHIQKTSAKRRIKCKFCGKSFDPIKHMIKDQQLPRDISFVNASDYK